MGEIKVHKYISKSSGKEDRTASWNEGEDKVSMEYHHSHDGSEGGHTHYRYTNTETGETLRTHESDYGLDDWLADRKAGGYKKGSGQ